MSQELQRIHVQSILGKLDRSWFPSTLLSIKAENPADRGEDLQWQIFLSGATHGAELGFNQMGPRLDSHRTALVDSYQHLEQALLLSDDMEVAALESLLAARNVLAKHLAEEWQHFHDGVLDWTSSLLGVRSSYFKEASDFNPEALGIVLMTLLNRGRFHPFWAWAVETYPRGRNVHLGEMTALVEKFYRAPPLDEINQAANMVPIANAAKQYIAWAKVEYEDLQRRIAVKAAGMVIPDEALATWVGTEILKDTGE